MFYYFSDWWFVSPLHEYFKCFIYFSDWWFVSPLHEYEDIVPLIEESNLPWPCTKCTRRFQQVKNFNKKVKN